MGGWRRRRLPGLPGCRPGARPHLGLALDWAPHPDDAIPVAGLLAKTACPVLLIHGTADATNLYAESVALASVVGATAGGGDGGGDQAPSAGRATFLSAEGYGHDDVEIRCPAYGPALRSFLGRAFEAGAARGAEE